MAVKRENEYITSRKAPDKNCISFISSRAVFSIYSERKIEERWQLTQNYIRLLVETN